MTNTYALTDYDVYQEEDFDNYSRRRRKLGRRLGNRPMKSRRFVRYPKLGRPPRTIKPIRIKTRPKAYVKKAKVIRGRPVKLPPITVPKTVSVIKPKPIKKHRPSVVKKKTPINHLIKKTNPKPVKTPLSKPSLTRVNQLPAAQVEVSKKAMQTNIKNSKVIKVIAIVSAIGITGFGIYKIVQHQKIKVL